MRLIMRTYDMNGSCYHIIVKRRSAADREIIDGYHVKGLVTNFWKIFEAIQTLGNRWARSLMCLVTGWRSRKYDLHDAMLGLGK